MERADFGAFREGHAGFNREPMVAFAIASGAMNRAHNEAALDFFARDRGAIKTFLFGREAQQDRAGGAHERFRPFHLENQFGAAPDAHGFAGFDSFAGVQDAFSGGHDFGEAGNFLNVGVADEGDFAPGFFGLSSGAEADRDEES